MVEKIGMGPANFGSDRLEGHRLRSLLKQELAGRGECGGPTFLGTEARSSY